MLLVLVLAQVDYRDMRKNLRKITILALLAVLVMMTAAVDAFPYQIGDYKVDVTVRNSAMNLIAGIKVALYRYDKSTILVEAAAAGYQTLNYRLAIREDQTYYKIDLVLADPLRRVHVVDHNDRPIEAAYVRLEQFGFPSDHFGVTAYIPVQMWPSALSERVDIFDSFWGMPLKKTCEITQVDEFYCVKLSMTRRSLKWSGKDLYVSFKTSAPAQAPALAARLATLEKIIGTDTYPAGSEEAMALYLADNFSTDELSDCGIALPASLERLTALRSRFAELHRENNEIF